MRLKLAVFDIDGTLVDSRQTITRAMTMAFQAEGLPDPGYEGTRQIVGLSLRDAVCRLAPPDIGAQRLDRLVSQYKNAFITHRTQPDFDEPLYDGTIALLERLRDEGWLIGMATGKARRGIEALFAHHPIAHFFDATGCADDGPGKPNPFMLEKVMGELGARAEDTVMIGDTTHDMVMARAARTRAFAVTWGFHTADEIAQADPHHIFECFPTLGDGLDRFGG